VLRHYLASLLIASGADVKAVQARLRHASAKTALDAYGHLWRDADESECPADGAVLAARADIREVAKRAPASLGDCLGALAIPETCLRRSQSQ
jgi:integrase